jgi:hypothetical protein
MCASSNSEAACEILDDNTELKAAGKVIDEICKVSLSYQGDVNEEDRISRLDHWRDICQFGLGLNKYPTGESIKEVLGLIFSWERSDYDVPDMKDCGQQFEEFRNVMMISKHLPARVVLDYLIKIDSSVYRVLWFYGPILSVCITKNGYLGLVPRKTQPGDKIALLS